MAHEQSGEGAPPEVHRTETVDRYLECVYYIAHEGETVRPSRPSRPGPWCSSLMWTSLMDGGRG